MKTYADGIGPCKPYLIPSKCLVIEGGACRDASGDGKVNDSAATGC